MAGADGHCPHCGAELRGGTRKSGSLPGGTPGCPYDGLAFAALGIPLSITVLLAAFSRLLIIF